MGWEMGEAERVIEGKRGGKTFGWEHLRLQCSSKEILARLPMNP